MDKHFLTATSKNIKKTQNKDSAFSHYLELPHTENFVKVNFFSDTDIKKTIEPTGFKILDELSFSKSLYSPSMRSLLDLKLKNWDAGGPFRAYLLAIEGP